MKPTPIPISIRSICCIGAGYVGGPTMAVIADRCPHVQQAATGVDALLLLTEWQAFAQIDWPAVARRCGLGARLFQTRAKAVGAVARAPGLKLWTAGSQCRLSNEIMNIHTELTNHTDTNSPDIGAAPHCIQPSN